MGADAKFKPFHETYKIVSLAMTLSLLYPNPRNDKTRRYIILSLTALSLPVGFMLLYDIAVCWGRRDIFNIIRHGTVVIPFVVTFSKIYVMYYNRVEAKALIDEINDDYEKFSSLSDEHQAIVAEEIKLSRFSEKAWAVTVFFSVFIFPGMSTANNIYSAFFDEEQKKYMIHDLNMPFTEPELRFETPYFELMHVYMMFCCFLMFVNFIGLDGFFEIAINHACLKMRLYCVALSDAMQKTEGDEIYQDVVTVVEQQNQFFQYVETIRKTFNFWLGTILVGAMIHVCICMYQIMEGYGIDLVYVVFIVGSVIHIYLPCRYAGKLKSSSVETATQFYCSGWENVPEQRIRKMLLFMMARAQSSEEITAFNLLAFDMELFVSLMHTSYSMFTLLRS